MKLIDLYRRNRKEYSAATAFNLAKAKQRYDSYGLDFRDGNNRGNWFTQARLELEHCAMVIEVHDDYDCPIDREDKLELETELPYYRRRYGRHEAYNRCKENVQQANENLNAVSAACGIVTYIEGLKDTTTSSCGGYTITDNQDWFREYYPSILEHIDESLALYEEEITESKHYANHC